jgi:hypothetical protein
MYNMLACCPCSIAAHGQPFIACCGYRAWLRHNIFLSQITAHRSNHLNQLSTKHSDANQSLKAVDDIRLALQLLHKGRKTITYLQGCMSVCRPSLHVMCVTNSAIIPFCA